MQHLLLKVLATSVADKTYAIVAQYCVHIGFENICPPFLAPCSFVSLAYLRIAALTSLHLVHIVYIYNDIYYLIVKGTCSYEA